MRRAPIVLAATVAGTAGVVAFNPQPQGSAAPVEAALPTSAHGSPAGSVVMGPAVRNPYGTVQVQVARRGGRIVDVRAIRLPDGSGRSAEISRYAGPLLKQEALRAQSGHVDAVSGATYTSDGYRASLQAALDQAGRRPAGNGAPA